MMRFNGNVGTPRFLLMLVILLSPSLASPATAQVEKKEKASIDDWFRPEADPDSLRKLLKDEYVSDRWIYHDLDAARREAKKSGKPILAVFRCVPCGSAPGLDGAVCTAGGAEASRFEAEIRAAGGKLDELLDQFVAVRMVKMNGVNRSIFQFDRDVPYVAVILNADGVIYGRYGTRVSRDRKNLPRHNLSSLQQSLRRALALHKDFPKNEAQLKAKSGPKLTPPMTRDMATFEPFPEKHNGAVSNCIHCHTVGEAEVRQTLTDDKVALRDVWPYPLPHNVGLVIDAQDGLKVKAVEDDSAAKRAGIQPGDVVTHLADQPLVSEADIQWALHHAPDRRPVPIVVRRGDRVVKTELALEGDWRRSDSHWRASLSPLRPNIHLRPDPYKVKKGAKPGQMGLAVHYPRGEAAKAGLRGGDLLVAVDGRSDMAFESDFLKYIHIDQPNARSVELTIIRKGTRLTVTLPLR